MSNLKLTTQLIGLLALQLCCSVAGGFELFTVGKNKPTKLSTMANGGGNPLQGNDGKYLGPPHANVLHTDFNDPMPWWMVDMQQPYAIFGARVWNRLDGRCPQRFTQISFGISNKPSVWTHFDKDLFDLCFYFTKVPTAADNPINITCNRPIVGRYLALYMNVTGLDKNEAYLHFVEIDILAISKAPSVYVTEMQPSFSTSSAGPLWSGQEQLSQSECLVRCSLLPHCLFALVRPETGDCWLFGSARIPDSFISSFASGGAKFLAVYG